jgi:hypothetical protein
MYTAWSPNIEGVWVPSVHADCNHNEIAALRLRSLGPTPGSAESARGPVLGAFNRIRALVSRRYGGQRWDLPRTAQSYTGALRRRYEEAERSLREDGPLSSSDYFLRAFLKAEKVDAIRKFPKPRMIYPRSSRYNLQLATWLKPFEHWLWGNLKSVGLRGVPPTRVVAKGLNGRQRANLIRRKMSQIPGCVVFEVDGKAFEAHVDRWQLECEHSVYAAAYKSEPDLMRLLGKQLHLSGVTKRGVTFFREGGRASGDFNTGMGNSLIMLAVVAGVMGVLGVRTWDSLVDGDNALLFLPPIVSNYVVESFARVALTISGHEMVLERPVTVIESVRFGQSAPVEISGRWGMLRDWRKVLSQGTSSHANISETTFALPYLRGVARCELSLAKGVPILQRWCEVVLEATRGVRDLNFDRFRDYQVLGVSEGAYLQSTHGYVIDQSTRDSFALAFGVSPSRQVEIEERLSWDGVLRAWQPVQAPQVHNWWWSEPGLIRGL